MFIHFKLNIKASLVFTCESNHLLLFSNLAIFSFYWGPQLMNISHFALCTGVDTRIVLRISHCKHFDCHILEILLLDVHELLIPRGLVHQLLHKVGIQLVHYLVIFHCPLVSVSSLMNAFYFFSNNFI